MAVPPDPSERGPAGLSVEAHPLRLALVILRRRWKLVALAWVVTLIADAVYTFTLPKLYRPQATLEIRPETPLISSETQDAAMWATSYLWENYYRTQESILTSTSLHKAVLKALPEPIRREYEESTDPVAAFGGKVTVEKMKNSFILKIGFIDPDAEKGTQIVNVLASLYIEDAHRHLRELRSGAAEVLSKEALPAMRKKVEDADQALREFQKQGGFIDPQEQSLALANARRAILERLTQIRLRHIQLQAQRDALSDPGLDGGARVFNPAFQNTKILELLAAQQQTIEMEITRESRELRPDHPTLLQLKDQLKRVEEKIQRAVGGILKAFDTDLTATEQEHKAALAELDRIEKQMSDISQRVFQAKRLEAELTTARELYTAYLKKHGEEAATSGSGIGSVRIIDRAVVPSGPFKPNIATNLAAGCVLGLLLGLASMFVSEQLDDRIRSAQEVEVFVGLDVLAVIPTLKHASSTDRPSLLDEKSSFAEFETFRAMRAEVTTRLEDIAGPKILGILSPMSSEGKSTVTANLAKVLAMDGRRVLIFDADMRRPTMNSNFGSTEMPDLGKALEGAAPFEQAVRRSRIPGVDIVGMAAGTSQAAELAGSARFEEIFKRLRQGYDFVIVDSAPVNQASESALIARRCDAVVMVLRERSTSRHAAQASRKRLEGMNARILGTVLNAAEGPENAYGYYYSYYKPADPRKS